MSSINQITQPDLDPISGLPKRMVDPSYEVAPVSFDVCRDGTRCGVPPETGDDAYCANCPNRPSEKKGVSCACGDSYPMYSYGAGFIVANGGVCENCDMAKGDESQQRSKYHREIKPGVWVDCYDVLQAWPQRPRNRHERHYRQRPAGQGA